MKHFDYIVVGGGIAGLITAYFFKDFKTLLIDKKGILKGASGAAGAFLFPKIGRKSQYTVFINSAILASFAFYEKLGIDIHKKGVLLLPRDERDIEKFKVYEKEITLPFVKKKGGFFFKDGGFIEVDEVREKIKISFQKEEVTLVKKEKECWRVNDFYTKNVILATGYEEIIDIPYIKIRPIWGERIEIEGEFEGDFNHFYHKNCSIAKINNQLRIGATHKRNCLECKENIEEANELIQKAKEIVTIKNYKIKDIKGGFRSGSVDYFPILGKIIDVKKTLLNQPKIIKGEIPKKYEYIEGLYIINGMGGRGFSNAIICAKILRDYILNNQSLGVLDNKRLFIKWARKEGEKFYKLRIAGSPKNS